MPENETPLPQGLALRILTATNRKLTGVEAAELIREVRKIAARAARGDHLTAIVEEIDAARAEGDMCAFWAAIGKLYSSGARRSSSE